MRERRGASGGSKKNRKNSKFSWLFVFTCVSLLLVNKEQLIRKRDKLLARLPQARDILRGSLLDRTIRHRTGCKQCERGGGHPVSVLTVGQPGGVMKQTSLNKDQVPRVRQCLANYYALKAALEEICEINRQLLRAKPAVATSKRSPK